MADHTLHAQGHEVIKLPTPTIAIPARSKGSDFCTKCTGSIWGVVRSKHDEQDRTKENLSIC